MRRFILFFALTALPLGVAATELPVCAATGSKTVMIEGKPALRLSDVVMCPPDTYEIIATMQIDGQPMVHFKPVQFGKVRCAVLDESTTVTAESKTPATQQGLHCSTN
jgi:hypothetical protein